MPGRRRLGWLAVAVAAVVAIALTVGLRSGSDGSSKTTPASGPAQAPALTSAGATPSAGDLGDPAVLTVPSGISGPARYILFGTNDWPAHVPTATSPDLKTWTPGRRRAPGPARLGRTERERLARVGPAAARIDGRWLLYVTLPDRRSGRQCIGVTTSSRPEGPYRDALGKPLVCQVSLGGSIDPSLAGPPSHRMLLWKSDGNCCGKPAILWSQSLTADGKALAGKPHELLRVMTPLAATDRRGTRSGARIWWRLVAVLLRRLLQRPALRHRRRVLHNARDGMRRPQPFTARGQRARATLPRRPGDLPGPERQAGSGF